MPAISRPSRSTRESLSAATSAIRATTLRGRSLAPDSAPATADGLMPTATANSRWDRSAIRLTRRSTPGSEKAVTGSAFDVARAVSSHPGDLWTVVLCSHGRSRARPVGQGPCGGTHSRAGGSGQKACLQPGGRGPRRAPHRLTRWSAPDRTAPLNPWPTPPRSSNCSPTTPPSRSSGTRDRPSSTSCWAPCTTRRPWPTSRCAPTAAPGPDVLALVPYRQVTERGFVAHDDGMPLSCLVVERHLRVAVDDFVAACPASGLTLADIAYDLDDDEYADVRPPDRARRDRPGRGRQLRRPPDAHRARRGLVHRPGPGRVPAASW